MSSHAQIRPLGAEKQPNKVRGVGGGGGMQSNTSIALAFACDLACNRLSIELSYTYVLQRYFYGIPVSIMYYVKCKSIFSLRNNSATNSQVCC